MNIRTEESTTRKLPPLTENRTHFDAILELNDDDLRELVEEVELPPLLVTLAQLTGRDTLLDPSLSPPLHPSPAEIEAHGGMSEENQRLARKHALEALRELRDNSGGIRTSWTHDELRKMMSFITGQQGNDYLPLLLNELRVEPADGPSVERWTKDEKAPNRSFSVAIIGAGMSGLGAAYQLGEAGIDYTVFEKNEDVGGTWLENTYPGCRLDTNNFAYTYSFAQAAGWGQYFTLRDPIYKYFRDISDITGIRKNIHFNSEVVEATFNESSCTWVLQVRDNSGNVRQIEVDSIISAVGQLNRPKYPEIPGQSTFKGKSWHSAKWNHAVSLDDLRVGVVGTGASAYQIVPAIADRVKELKVFQRTPPWMLPTPNYHEEIPPRALWAIREMPYLDRWQRFYQFWISAEGRRRFVKVDEEWAEAGSVSKENAEMRQALIDRLEEQLGDRPELLERMIPEYPPGAKRMLRDNGVWSEAIRKDNVSLITDSILEIESNGIVTRQDGLHELDVIIYATGFEASDFLAPMRIFGRGGIELRDQWGDDPRAHLGITIPSFPNLFCLYGPNTALVVNGSAFFMVEAAINYILECYRLLFEEGFRAMDCKLTPFRDYNDELDSANREMAWGIEGVDNWYKGKTGRVTQVWPHSLLKYWEMTRVPRDADYEFLGSDNN